MSIAFRPAAIPLAIGLLMAVSFGAKPVFGDVFVYDQLCALASGGNINANCSPTQQLVQTPTGPLTLSDSFQFVSYSTLPDSTPVTSYYIASAGAYADYGTLGASVFVTLLDYRRGSFQLAQNYGVAGNGASSGFDDMLTISNGVGNGVLNLSFDVEGLAFVPDIGNGDFNGSYLSVNNATPAYIYPLESAGLENFTVPFTFGTPFDLSVSLNAGIGIFDYPQTIPDPYSFIGFVNFLNTATLTDMLVTDTNGNPIPGVSITADSGTDYPVDPLNGGAPAPEPSFYIPLAGAVLGLMAIRRRGHAAIVS